MSNFTTPLVVELVGKNKFKLYDKFIYHIGTYPSNEIIEVPVGIMTDFASVPRIFWSIISPIDSHGKAAVLHDFLYQVTYKNNRKLCDNIFLEALSVLNVNKNIKTIIYYAVRLFGWVVWNKYKKENTILFGHD